MTRRGGWGAALGFVLMFGAGCGGAEMVDPEEGEAVRGVLAERSSAVETEPAVDPEIARLARFWTVDRFVLDGAIGPLVRKRHTSTVLAKAQPDECFGGVGVAGEPLPDADGNCAVGIPKTNDAYVWGLARADRKLFFGTLANTNCLVEQGYLGNDQAHLNDLYVCEFGQNPTGTQDFRAPNLFRYDLETRQLKSLNPPPGTPEHFRRIATGGFRSAGALNGTAFVAGPSFSAAGGITVFVFDGATDALLAIRTLNDAANPYTNVRQWAVAEGGLYVGIGTANGTGRVLRWTPTAADPYAFTTVGLVPSDAANMIFHSDGRLYVTTWPGAGKPAGLYRSPVLPSGGLTAAHATHADWSVPLWLATQYDPDLVTAMHYGGGALASWKGRIIFGTMHVPFSAARGAMEEYGLDASQLLQTALGTHRSIAIFEVKFPAGKRANVSMLYGEKYLPTWDAAAGAYTIRYDRAHRTGFVPRWGPSGFGNFFNSYTWTMEVLGRDLFIGTFDWSQLVLSELSSASDQADQLLDLLQQFARVGLLFPKEGADVIRFDWNDGVWAESVNGMGNDRNYGIRTMVKDDRFLYFGTANPMNLDPKGGWELLEVAAW